MVAPFVAVFKSLSLLPWEFCMWFQWIWNWPFRADSISSFMPAEYIPTWSNLSWRNSKRDKFCLGLSFVMSIALGLAARSFLKAWGKAEPKQSQVCRVLPLPLSTKLTPRRGFDSKSVSNCVALLGFRLDCSGSLSLQAAARNLDLSRKGSLFPARGGTWEVWQGQAQLCLYTLSMGKWCTDNQSIRTETV